MKTLISIFQIIIALGILNVWLLRKNKPSIWRGGQAKSLKEEFAAYGLPISMMRVVGFLKVWMAVMLIAGLWVPSLVKPAAGAVVLLMLGAVSMHLKVRDPFRKSLPAFVLLVLSLIVAFGA
jgi:uncharacterized membrane-anchored protein